MKTLYKATQIVISRDPWFYGGELRPVATIDPARLREKKELCCYLDLRDQGAEHPQSMDQYPFDWTAAAQQVVKTIAHSLSWWGSDVVIELDQAVAAAEAFVLAAEQDLSAVMVSDKGALWVESDGALVVGVEVSRPKADHLLDVADIIRENGYTPMARRFGGQDYMALRARAGCEFHVFRKGGTWQLSGLGQFSHPRSVREKTDWGLARQEADVLMRAIGAKDGSSEAHAAHAHMETYIEG